MTLPWDHSDADPLGDVQKFIKDLEANRDKANETAERNRKEIALRAIKELERVRGSLTITEVAEFWKKYGYD